MSDYFWQISNHFVLTNIVQRCPELLQTNASLDLHTLKICHYPINARVSVLAWQSANVWSNVRVCSPKLTIFLLMNSMNSGRIQIMFQQRKMLQLLGSCSGSFCIPIVFWVGKRWIYFSIEEQDMKFCLNTPCKIFGLGQKAHTAAKTRPILRDKKAIGLSLLKKTCWLDLKNDPAYKTLYRTYRSWFPQSVGLVSKTNLLWNQLSMIWVELLFI